jgi:hypothetical protein
MCEEIIKAVKKPVFAMRVQTPEDFDKYSEKMVALARVFTHRNLFNKALPHSIKHALEMTSGFAQVIGSLAKDDFDDDVDILTDTLKDPYAFDAYYRIHSLVKSSSDIKAYKHFLDTHPNKALPVKPEDSKASRYMQALFGKDDRENNGWGKALAKDGTVSDVFSYLDHYPDPAILREEISHLTKLPPDNRIPYIQATEVAEAQGIPHAFGKHFDDYASVVAQCDFTRDDLGRMGNERTQIGFLHFLPAYLVDNPTMFSENAHYFTDALAIGPDNQPVNPSLFRQAQFALNLYVDTYLTAHPKATGEDLEEFVSLIPQAAELVKQQLKKHDHIRKFSYEGALQGEHPDIKSSVKERMDQPDRARIGVHLWERDAFTDLCFDTAEQLRVIDKAEIQRTEQSFTTPIKIRVFDSNRSIVKDELAEDVGYEVARYTQEYHALSETEVGKASKIVDSFEVPVGAYGEAFTKRLAETTRVMLKLSEIVAGGKAHNVNRQFSDLIFNETARSYKDRIDVYKDPPLATLQEGIISITDAISLLVAEKQDGFDDPDAYLEALILKNLPSHLSQHFPLGIMAPTLRRGEYIKDLVEVDDDGSPQVAEAFVRGIAEIKSTYRDRARRYWTGPKPKSQRNDSFTGHGCPVGKKGHEYDDTGIGSLSKAFYYIYKSLAA